MSKIITIAQQKGGSGKTSLAIHLAAEWTRRGKAVALLDADPQGTAMAWARLRPSPAPFPVEAAEGWRAPQTAQRLARDHAIVLVDTAPHAETSAQTALRAADFALVPMQPSPLDLWATQATLAMAADEDVPALVVLSRVPPRANLVGEIAAELAQRNLAVARTRLGNRTAFASAMQRGATAVDAQPRSKAAAEIRALAGEIARRLGRL